MRYFITLVCLPLLAFAMICSSVATLRPEFRLYWDTLAQVGFCSFIVAMFVGALAYIYQDAMRDRERARKVVAQMQRLELFNRTVYAIWENPTRAKGWYGVLDQSYWKRAK